MFQYQLGFWRQLKGTHPKLIGNVILFWILVMLIGAITMIAYIIPIIIGGVLADSGNNRLPGILGAIIGVLIIVAVGIFIYLPLMYGMNNYFFLAYKRRNSTFGDGFFAFKKGIYFKSLGFIIILVLISLVIQIGINIVFSALSLGISLISNMMNSTASTFMIIFSGILLFLFVLITILLYIALQGFILSAWFRHLESPLSTIGEKIKIGYQIIFKNIGKYVKLIISNLLLSLGIVVLAGIAVSIGALIMNSTDSQALFVIYTIIIGLIVLIFSIFLGYISYGSYGSFYFDSKHNLFGEDD